MLVYNIETNEFESVDKIPSNCVFISFCVDIDDFILMFNDENNELIHLHNEDERYDSICMDLFCLQDKKFKNFLDFLKKK